MTLEEFEEHLEDTMTTQKLEMQRMKYAYESRVTWIKKKC